MRARRLPRGGSPARIQAGPSRGPTRRITTDERTSRATAAASRTRPRTKVPGAPGQPARDLKDRGRQAPRSGRQIRGQSRRAGSQSARLRRDPRGRPPARGAGPGRRGREATAAATTHRSFRVRTAVASRSAPRAAAKVAATLAHAKMPTSLSASRSSTRESSAQTSSVDEGLNRDADHGRDQGLPGSGPPPGRFGLRRARRARARSAGQCPPQSSRTNSAPDDSVQPLSLRRSYLRLTPSVSSALLIETRR